MIGRLIIIFSLFTAAFICHTIGWLVIGSAEKRPFHTLQKTICNHVIQIFSFSQMISRIIHPPLHFYQNLLLHDSPLRPSKTTIRNAAINCRFIYQVKGAFSCTPQFSGKDL